MHNLPYITVLTYGGEEYVGIMINRDVSVTSFYDYESIRTVEEREQFLQIGELWWWESNRKIPISVFCRDQIWPYRYAIKTFNSKDVRVLMGPTTSLDNLAEKRVKRRSIQLIRRG
jgi:hypothetical protein